MSQWSDFYQTRLNQSYLDYVKTKYKTFIDAIESFKGNTIGEFGCGIGNITKLLERKSRTHYVYDNDIEMLKLAKLNLQYVDNVKFQQLDIQKGVSQSFDVIHSHGVLEHFSNKQIKTIIQNQLRLSKTLIHYVPSYKYGKPSFGDERLLTKQDWKTICNPNEIVEFNKGLDYILIWH